MISRHGALIPAVGRAARGLAAGDVGQLGWPVARTSRETARSIGLIGAASTWIVSPDGSATLPTSPTARMSAAFIAATVISGA